MFESGEDLDARNNRLRQHVGRRGGGSQQPVNTHAHVEPVAKRLDVDVARAQFDRFFDEVIDRAHDWRAARQIPQIIDVLVGAALLLPTVGRRVSVEIELVAQNGCYVFERSRYNFKRPAKNELSRL